MVKWTCYTAGPLFTPDQIDTCEKVEAMLSEYEFSFFSPRLNGGVFNKEASKEEREKQARAIFVGNENAMSDADFAVVNLDDKDTGTAWEFGYFYAKGTPCVSYSKHGYGANIMLSQSGLAHFSDLSSLKLFLKHLKKNLKEMKPRENETRKGLSFVTRGFKKSVKELEEVLTQRFRGISDE